MIYNSAELSRSQTSIFRIINRNQIIHALILFQTRSLVNLFEEDAEVLRTYTKALHQCCQRTFNAQVHILVEGIIHNKKYDN